MLVVIVMSLGGGNGSGDSHGGGNTSGDSHGGGGPVGVGNSVSTSNAVPTLTVVPGAAGSRATVLPGHHPLRHPTHPQFQNGACSPCCCDEWM